MAINRRNFLTLAGAAAWGALSFPRNIFAAPPRSRSVDREPGGGPRGRAEYSCEPYTRWWWFSQPIDFSDIQYQLDWLKRIGFGGVEIAWVYALDPKKPGVKWLGPEWSELVTRTKRYASQIGLGCDFTFGSMWPFGGTFVGKEDAAKTFDGLSSERLTRNWETPLSGESYVIDHLSSKALRDYSEKMGAALRAALEVGSSALFCDSLEINTVDIWSDGLWEKFIQRMGYDLAPFKDKLDQAPDVRYDYRKFVGEVMVKEFFRTFTTICHELGGFSRVQCHGAPSDLLAAYASVDVPESESILFNPYFSRIAASAAALSEKSIVSAETFTCLYGYPKVHHKAEKITDLKALVDALLAHGVNHFFYHGMPFNPKGGNQAFYATVHIGPDSAFVADLPRLNAYVTKLAQWMRAGKAHSRLAVYLPNEDNRRLGDLPPSLQTPGAGYYWEMRTVDVPDETRGFAPLWISPAFLQDAQIENGRLRVGSLTFDALYLDVEFLDAEALVLIESLVRRGMKIILKRRPDCPGKVIPADYQSLLDAIQHSPRHFSTMESAQLEATVEGKDLPPLWAREADGSLWIFFAHPSLKGLVYPMPYGFAETMPSVSREVIVRFAGRKNKVSLRFATGESILLRIDRNGISQVNLPW